MKPSATSFLYKYSSRIILAVFRDACRTQVKILVPFVLIECWGTTKDSMKPIYSPVHMIGGKCWMSCWWMNSDCSLLQWWEAVISQLSEVRFGEAAHLPIVSYFCSFTRNLGGQEEQSAQLRAVREFTPWRKHLPFSIEISLGKRRCPFRKRKSARGCVVSNSILTYLCIYTCYRLVLF